MSDSVFIFTFSPVQPFISEARRTADLRSGSQILARLAKSVLAALNTYAVEIIFPAGETDSPPNKIVAILPWHRVDAAAKLAETRFAETWDKLAQQAKADLQTHGAAPDEVWESIWQRQANHFWEIYWSAARIDNQRYAAAYQKAEKALAANKRCRPFAASQEAGIKDSLSGRRQALRTGSEDAAACWGKISERYPASKIRPGERLDAIGAIKRFSDLSREEESRFPSTSSVASDDFLAAVSRNAQALSKLEEYGHQLKTLLGSRLFQARPNHPVWGYDGDFLYEATLTPSRLKAEYGVAIEREKLKPLIQTLRSLYDLTGWKQGPSPYYAILAMDGDNMGQHINQLIKSKDPQQAHAQFSRALAEFAGQVGGIVSQHMGALVYNGGDDVLALLPLRECMAAHHDLSEAFMVTTREKASAGIAVVHHGYPLGAALQTARQAESRAKKVTGKNAVCVTVVKGSAQTVELRSPREEMKERFPWLVDWFSGDPSPLSSGFAYDLLEMARSIPDTTADEAQEIFASLCKRSISRQRSVSVPENQQVDPSLAAEDLSRWAENLYKQGVHFAPAEVGKWLTFARFVAAGGSE